MMAPRLTIKCFCMLVTGRAGQGRAGQGRAGRAGQGRAGLAALMASALVVLNHETSTRHQSHNFISIKLTFGVSDYSRNSTSLAKFGLDLMRGQDATWGQHIRVL